MVEDCCSESSGNVEGDEHNRDFSMTQTVIDLRDTLPYGNRRSAGGEVSDDVVADLERLLQSLLLEQGLLDDQVLGPPMPRDDDGCSNGATVGSFAARPQTFRELRQTGALAELSQDAQATLLGGTLFSYGELEAGKGAAAASHRGGVGDTTVGDAGAEALEDAEELLAGFRSDPGFRGTEAASTAGPEEWAAALLNMAAGLPLSPRSSGSPSREATPALARSSSRERILAAALQEDSNTLDDDEDQSEEDAGAPIMGYDSASSSSTLSREPPPAGSRPGLVQHVAADPLAESASHWNLADTVNSLSSTLRSAGFEESARTVLLDTLNIDEDTDGSLTGMLHRLAYQSLALDESLHRSVRRILQLGTVLTGQHLSEDEIGALPRVRFEQSEQQNCPICLEAYQRGELLTSLKCRHFFHVDCLARWFRRSTQCPLCRSDYDDQDDDH